MSECLLLFNACRSTATAVLYKLAQSWPYGSISIITPRHWPTDVEFLVSGAVHSAAHRLWGNPARVHT